MFATTTLQYATPKRGVGKIFKTNSVSDVATQLKERLPLPTERQYDLILENDLTGRAALAMLWPNREQLAIHLVTDDPKDRNAHALQSALATVRNPPTVQILSAEAAAEVAWTSQRLVWAVASDRTNASVQTTLRQRDAATTYLPYANPLAAFEGQHPDQTDPAHELLLRDVIREHTAFLNFFGDRFNPKDLYERSKYPRWFTPPPGFSAAIPPLAYTTTARNGTVVDSEDFVGTLQLDSQHLLTDHRAQVEFAPIIEAVESGSCDATLHLSNDYTNPNGTGALSLEIHHNGILYAQFDVATNAPKLQVPLRAISSGDTLTLSVVAHRDNPKSSWAIASRTDIQLAVHPSGTHPAPPLLTRTKSWLRRIRRRLQKGT